MDLGTILGIAGIVIGVPALAMAIPPFAQMIFGRPKLKFTFDEFTGPDGKNLLVKVENEAIKSRVLRWIGVHRDNGEINASITVLEQGTNRAVAIQIPATINDPVSRQISLLAICRAHFHVGFPVIHGRPHGPVVFDPRRNEEIKLPDGLYIAVILIVCGDRSHTLQKPMNLHTDPTRTFWF